MNSPAGNVFIRHQLMRQYQVQQQMQQPRMAQMSTSAPPEEKGGRQNMEMQEQQQQQQQPSSFGFAPQQMQLPQGQVVYSPDGTAYIISQQQAAAMGIFQQQQ